jgi:hypothetical protein
LSGEEINSHGGTLFKPPGIRYETQPSDFKQFGLIASTWKEIVRFLRSLSACSEIESYNAEISWMMSLVFYTPIPSLVDIHLTGSHNVLGFTSASARCLFCNSVEVRLLTHENYSGQLKDDPYKYPPKKT